LVAVALDQDVEVRVGLQVLRVLRERRPGLFAQRVAVVVEINGGQFGGRAELGAPDVDFRDVGLFARRVLAGRGRVAAPVGAGLLGGLRRGAARGEQDCGG